MYGGRVLVTGAATAARPAAGTPADDAAHDPTGAAPATRAAATCGGPTQAYHPTCSSARTIAFAERTPAIAMIILAAGRAEARAGRGGVVPVGFVAPQVSVGCHYG